MDLLTTLMLLAFFLLTTLWNFKGSHTPTKIYSGPKRVDNYYPVSNVKILSKVIEQVESGQFQGLWNKIDYLDLFQSSFRPGNGTEMALVTLVDMCQETDRECV